MSREPKSSITHLSDTALWVATFRALEGQRANAAFDDPLAATLAGERGCAIAGTFSRRELTAWSSAVPSMNKWVQDFDNSGKPALPKGWAKSLESAPLLFGVKDWFEFFENYGWKSFTKITSFEESSRINRPYPVDFPYGLLMRVIPKEWRQKILDLSEGKVMWVFPAPKEFLKQEEVRQWCIR